MNPGEKRGEKKEQYKQKREKKEEKRLTDPARSGAGCEFWFQPSRQSQAVRAEPWNSEGRADTHSPGSLRPGCVSCSAIYSTTICFSFFSCERSMRVVQFSSVQFSRSVVSDSLRPHESQPARPPCRSPTPGVHSNSCPLRR